MPTPATLLVIDPSSEVRRVIRRVINRYVAAYTVLECHSVQEALQVLRNQTVTVILSNFTLSGGTAHDVLAALPFYHQPPRLIAMSSVADREAELLAAGAIAVLPKPFALDHLVDVVTRVVSDGEVLA